MTDSLYLILIKCFLVLMPIELGIVGAFAWVCIQHHKTDQPAFWYALLCTGVLIPELVRGVCILLEKLPPHPKHLVFWISELLPFGGFVYEISKRHLTKVWANFRND